MQSNSYRKQIQAVILVECALIVFGAVFAWKFWGLICPTNLIHCVSNSQISVFSFFLLCLFRPFLFTPAAFFALMAGNAFGSYLGGFIATLGSLLSCLVVFILAKIVGKRLVSPWLRSNLPHTLAFIRSQDWKIVLVCRLMPLFPFDLFTFAFGLADFRFFSVVLATFFGTLPEAFLLAEMANPHSTFFVVFYKTSLVIAVFYALPGILFEFYQRKKGSSLFRRAKAALHELKEEIHLNNKIVRKHVHDTNKIPVLLLYGFFSSRRALTVIERILVRKGYEVFSFNLGGLFGVFFTSSITETAGFIDYKINRQITRHNLKEIKIIAHSKGGLVATWWLLKLGGHKYCKNIITLGTPFKGTLLTWLALITPLGFFFKDMWQMRPGSDLLRDLDQVKIPDGLVIHNFYSDNDRVATGMNGILQANKPNTQIKTIAMHHVGHFEFLARRDVGDALSNFLGSPYVPGLAPENMTEANSLTPSKNKSETLENLNENNSISA